MYGRRNNFKDFHNKTVNYTHNGQYSYYIKNEMIINKDLVNDFMKPHFLS